MNEFLPIFAALALLLLALASYRLNRAVQPLRLEFAEKSEKLLANQNLPASMGTFVRSLQGMAFGSRGMLIFALIVVPFLAASLILYPKFIEQSSKRFWIDCAETRAQFDEVNRLHDRIMFFNNPILMFVVACELMLCFAPAILLHGIFRGAMSVRFNADVARSLVEETSAKFRSAMPAMSFAS